MLGSRFEHNLEWDPTLMDEDYLRQESDNSERWLVSYADMMTLLFGLFVMLFSLAMETQGRPDQILSDIPNTSQRRPSSAELEQWKAYAEKLKAYSEMMKKKYEELADRMKNSVSASQLSSLKAENEKLKKRIQELMALLDSLKNQQANLSPQLLDELNRLREQLADYEMLKQKLVSLEDQAKQNLQHEKTITQLNDKIRTLEQTIRDGIENKKASSFFMLTLQWDSEKHDLDLIVTDPFGNQYDFENRIHKNNIGKLVLDSRTGPGVEMWKSIEFTPGKYLAQIKFYNTYGNSRPARAKLIAISNVGEFVIMDSELDFSKDKLKRYEIDVLPNGNIQAKFIQ